MTTRDKIICATVFFVCLFASWAGLVFAGKAPADAFVAFLSTTLAGGCAAFLALLKPDAVKTTDPEPFPATAAIPAAAPVDSGASYSPASTGVPAEAAAPIAPLANAPEEAANA